MQSHSAALAAIADPTRRLIVERIRHRPSAVSDIARGLPISRPAVSQHLAVLRQSGLVSERRDGRRRVYRLELAGLAGLRDYVEGLWSDVLSAYAAAAEREARQTGEKEPER